MNATRPRPHHHRPRHARPLAPVLGLLLAGGAAQAATGTVQGQALDTAGKPLGGVQVWIKPVVTTGVAEAVTDGKGRYTVPGLPPVGYRGYAWLAVPYRGKTFCYRLASAAGGDDSPFVPNGTLTRNFRWQLSGRIPDQEPYSDLGYYGGSLPLMAGFGQERWATQDDEIELTLTPTGPLIDGSAGKVLTRTAPARGMALDVPIGTYRVQATFIAASGKREPLTVSATDGDYAAQATVNFRPSGDTCKGTTGGAPGRAYVYWRFQ